MVPFVADCARNHMAVLLVSADAVDLGFALAGRDALDVGENLV